MAVTSIALRIALIPLLTLLLLLGAALSFFVFGGLDALRGPLVAEQWWLLIFPLQALIVGVAVYLVGRVVAGRIDRHALSAVILVAWLGELLVLALGVLPAEFLWTDAIALWAVLTGGPIQPFAAFAGGLLGLRR